MLLPKWATKHEDAESVDLLTLYSYQQQSSFSLVANKLTATTRVAACSVYVLATLNVLYVDYFCWEQN